jgi:hypothetical protein
LGELVDDVPVLCEPAVTYEVDVDAGNGDVLVRGGHAEEAAAVVPGVSPPHHHLVALGDEVFDCELQGIEGLCRS